MSIWRVNLAARKLYDEALRMILAAAAHRPRVDV
jgi:hypothetical protein